MPILQSYLARTRGSAEMGARAELVMPAGETRASGYHPPYPLTLTRGEGSRVWDIDGNEYIDLNYNYTSLVHGHAYEPIVDAAAKVVREGTAWPARNPHQVELAELLVERVASVDLVRFCNSGSEAAMLALLVARTATGRRKVLMARNGYHGSHEAFLHGAGGAPGDWPDTLVAPFGDAEAFESILANEGDQIAAVFLEPAQGGVVTAPAEFFQRVLAAARAAGSVFVLDEVITFRQSTGGMQKTLGITPDITMFGKIIGGGFPVGAIGGRRDLMEHLDPRRGIINHSGTFNGNPLTAAAGVVSVRELTAERIAIMAGQAEELADRIAASAERRRLPLSILHAGSLLGLSFSTGERASRGGPNPMAANLHLAGLNHGLFFSSRGLLVLSTILNDRDMDEIAGRFDAALQDVADEA